MKYKGYNVPDDIIDSYVDKLGCSSVEACDAWLCDNGKAVSAEADAMTKKAQFAGVGKIVDADYKKAERKPRERKADEDKRMLIQVLLDCLMMTPDAECVNVVNLEKTIDFQYNGACYSVNLVKHRPSKNSA